MATEHLWPPNGCAMIQLKLCDSNTSPSMLQQSRRF